MAAKTELFDFYDDIIISNVKMKNLFQKFKISYENLGEGDDIILELTLKDSDTLQSLAYQYYNDKRYYWIFLLINNVVDYFYDWYLSYEEVRLLSQQYWDAGITYDFTNIDDLFTYLSDENDKKKAIKYLTPKYLNQFISQINNLN